MGTMCRDIAFDRGDRAVEQIQPAVNVADDVQPLILVWNCRILHKRSDRLRLGAAPYDIMFANRRSLQVPYLSRSW